MKAHARIRLAALSIAVAGTLLALPVLGLDCEMTCVKSPGAATPAPAHCPSHDDAGSNPHPANPSDSGCCVHHDASPALKVAVERVGSRSLVLAFVVSTPPSLGRQSPGALVGAPLAVVPGDALSHASPILRL